MIERGSKLDVIRRTVLITGVALGVGFAAGPAMSAGGVDPDADEILRSMTNHLGGLRAFSVDVDIDNEVIDLDGQKLHLNSSGAIAAERPNKLYFHRRSGAGDLEFIFDGKVVTLLFNIRNVYVQFESPGTIDDALRTVNFETGLDTPGGDLFYSDPYPGLAEGVVSGTYLGSGYVNGIECHHLAFRAEKVDWQVWVQAGDTPLPMKYLIISKWVTAAPQYVIRFRNWNTKPRIKSGRFDFSAPAGARKLDSIPVNAAGEFAMEETR